MKSSKKNTSSITPRAWIAVGILVVAVLSISAVFYWLTHNYAQDAAKSFESALAREGAIKECSIGDNGLGPDNKTPWYSAIYRIPLTQEPAIGKIKDAAAASDFTLVEQYPDINREDNRFFGDLTSKKSNYFGLSSGKQQLSVTIFGSKEYDSNATFCSVNKTSDTAKTTFKIQMTLPAYK